VIEPSFDAEFSLSLQKFQDGRIVARVTRMRGNLKYEELPRVYEAHGPLSAIDTARFVAVEHFELSNTECPGLKTIARELEQLKAPSPAGLRKATVLDGTRYTVSMIGTFETELSFGSGGPAVLVDWSDRSRKNIEKCLSAPTVRSRTQ
jgi:hypothetical protein